LSFLSRLFLITDLKYSGVDGGICKCQLLAKNPGEIKGSELCGLTVRIRDQDQDVRNEVKRIGYIRDRESDLELRIGDTLIIYISVSVA